MSKYLTQKEAFRKCEENGKFIVLESVDRAKIKSILIIAKSDVDSANYIKKGISKKSNQWGSVYKLYYGALHELVGAYLLFDKIKIDNHQCLFVYLCEKYNLDFNWDFFEKIRTKRNGINYYGSLINHDDWKEIELFFDLYIKKLKKEINKRLE